MKNVSTILFVLISAISFGQYCPALGPDQFLPCGVGTTTLTANLSQCGSGGIAPKQTTDYVVSNIPYATQTNIGTSIFMTDDSQQGPFNIGFNFCFYGTTYSQFYIGSNGWISFSGGQPTTFTSQAIPTTNLLVPKNCIMGPWQDWHPGLGGQIKYQTTGIAPCRKLTVSWIGVPMFSCTGNQGTFHIVIHESTNIIENYIQDKPSCIQWQGGTAVEGVHNAAGTLGVAVPGRNSTAWTATNDAWKWTPNGPTVNPVLTWYQVGNPIAIGTGNTINVTPPATGASYTCHFVYPTCNAGWATCNAFAGLGPDTVFVQPGPPIPIAGPIMGTDTICIGGVSEIYSVVMQPYNYLWSSVAPITSGQGTSQVDVDFSTFPAGFIPGAIQVTPQANGCVGSTVSFDVYVLEVIPTITPIGPFCEYDEFTALQAIPTPVNGVFSGVGVVGSSFYPNNAVGVNDIVYTYIQSGCVFDDTIAVIVYPKPTVDSITPHNAFFELCELGTTTVTWSALGSLAGYNEWTWNNQTYQQDNLTQTLGWDSSGVHIISVVHWANGCVSEPKTTTINIIQCPETIFYMPNAFTPDGNEWNQVWQPVLTSGINPTDFELYIYNRWGEVIWESHNIYEAWDGTYDNKQCKEGVYFYTAQCTDTKTAKKFTLQGHITLLK